MQSVQHALLGGRTRDDDAMRTTTPNDHKRAANLGGNSKFTERSIREPPLYACEERVARTEIVTMCNREHPAHLPHSDSHSQKELLGHWA